MITNMYVQALVSNDPTHRARLLQSRKPNAPAEWMQKLPQMARRLEESLFRSAHSFVRLRLCSGGHDLINSGGIQGYPNFEEETPGPGYSHGLACSAAETKK